MCDKKKIADLERHIELDTAIKKDHRVLIKEQKDKIVELKGFLQAMIDAGSLTDNMTVMHISITEPFFAAITKALSGEEGGD